MSRRQGRQQKRKNAERIDATLPHTDVEVEESEHAVTLGCPTNAENVHVW